jgi:hypothetical protein
MKPILIRGAEPELTGRQKKALREIAGRALDGTAGAVDVVRLPDREKIRGDMLEMLEGGGWTFSDRKIQGFENEDVTAVGGSVHPHVDHGLGLFAIMPLVLSGGYRGGLNGAGHCYLDHDRFSLSTPHGWVDGTPGDIIVFNGDVWHSWACNRCCAMYSMAVKKLRKCGVAKSA